MDTSKNQTTSQSQVDPENQANLNESELLTEQVLADSFLNLTIVDLNKREINLRVSLLHRKITRPFNPSSSFNHLRLKTLMTQDSRNLKLPKPEPNRLNETQIGAVQYEMVLELREFLNEHVYTCFHTHYHFEHQGKRINDYTELAELNLAEDNKIYMRPEKYDEKNARQHIKRVKDILSNPPVLQAQTETGIGQGLQQLSSTPKGDHALSETQSQDGEGAVEKDEKAEKQPLNPYEERLKKNYQDFMSIIERESKNEIPLPEKNGHHLLKDLFKNPIEREMNKVNHVKCLEAIQYSVFNPVPPYRRMVGDLFYLVVKTLDHGEIGITCCVNGFYRNDCIEKQVFSPGPSSKTNPCYSYTLVGCIYQISQQFGKNLEIYLDSILNTEPYFLTQPALPVHHWIVEEDKLSSLRLSQSKDDTASTLVPLFGLDPKGVRDWNEEFQVVKDFPKETMIQRIQRDRAIHKVYNDFLDAAVKGAQAIVNSNLMPLNPNESEKQQVFVYNYIFFSYAVDLIDSFRDLTSSENNPSFTQANHDIMGLRQLQILDVEGLHLLATCLVNYRGQRVIAQSIIPGILNNNDLTSLAEYGSVDENKTIYASEHFHGLMKKVCEQLNIKVNKVIDGSGKEVEIAGSTEVKGIKGTDKRNYLVDLQGLTPRDANYKGEEYHTCLLRPELLMIYQRTKNIDYAQTKIAQYTKTLEEEKAKVEQKKVEDMTEEEKEAYAKQKQDENISKLKEFDKYLKEAPKFTYNTNVFKNVNFALPPEEVKQDEELVEDLAKFLKEQALPKLIKDLQNVEGVPADSEGLEVAFHSHGINMRYLGVVAELLKGKDYNHLSTLIEREIVFRSAKHIFNEHIRESSDTYLASTISHLFNLLVAPFPLIDKLNEGSLVFEDQTIQNLIRPSQAEARKQEKVEEVKESAGQDSSAKAAAETDGKALSKNEKKKLKKKQKQQVKDTQPGEAKKQAKANDAGPADLSEMLFKQNMELQQFQIDDLFKEKSIANSLIVIERPSALSLKPSELYERIRYVAKKRYNHDLPEKQQDLKCLQHSNFKLSLLRDLCLKLGIKILSHRNKDYILDNDLNQLLNKLTQQVNAENLSLVQKSDKSKKKPLTVQQVTAESLSKYAYLPFQTSDIVEIFPVLKHLDLQNTDSRVMISQAKQAYKDGIYEKSFDLYTQCINSLLQITGPMNKEVSQCISKLASIQFKFGDFLQAIELQTKAIILQERVLGYDHPQTAYNYTNLAFYHHTCGYFSKAFEYMHRALNILKIAAGENHPDIASLYLNLGLMYQDFEHFQAAIDCFLESLYRNINLFGENHIQVAQSYQTIAHAYFQLHDFRKALDYQERAHKIITQILPENDQYIKNSQAQMDQFMKLSVYVEKMKAQEKNARPIGSNKSNGNQVSSTSQATKAQQAAQEAQEQHHISAQKARSLRAGGSLYQRMQNQKNRNVLDILEYNYIREQQALHALKLSQMEALAKQSASEEKDAEVKKESQ